MVDLRMEASIARLYMGYSNMMSVLKSLIVVFLSGVIEVISDCRVLVHEPWPIPHIIVPRDSVVIINCTAHTPLWLIDLANDTLSFALPFNEALKELFNAHGVYELPQIEMSLTHRLLINDTAKNNQTKIRCVQNQTASFITTLFLLDQTILLTGDIMNKGVKLSWSRESQSLANASLRFSLRISNDLNSQEIPWINQSSFYFTAPKGAPPCEVYNFSVTATYVSTMATYTGAGCSVPSPVLSIMLPSLPNISRLESSLHYVLKKQSTGFTLFISFKPASYCKDYPITNYTLEVNGIRNEEILVSVFALRVENFLIDQGNLSENAVYSFRIDVANTVGVVSTSDRQFYTTDVQVVTATLMEGVNTSTIQCEFIEDSNATGCRTVLTTNNGQKVYHNLTKNESTNSTAIAVTLEHPPSCYSGVEAFDIESDGTVGPQAIPGHILNPLQALCTPATLPVKPSSSGTVLEAWMIAMMSAVVVIILLTAVIIVIVCVCKSKKYQERILRCPCMCLCLADAHVEPQVRVQVVNLRNESISEEQHLPHQLKDDDGEFTTAAEGGMKTACSDMLTNCQLDEPAALYSEIPLTSKLREHTTPGGGGWKSENVYSEPGSKGPHTKRGKASVPLEEKLYDQPVGAIERTLGNGADYSRTSYCQQASPVPMNDLATANDHGAQYSTLDKPEDHIYFTLESDKPRHNINPSPTCTSPQTPFIHDTQVPLPPATTSVSPPPVYQEITEISSRRGESAATRAVTTNGDSNTPLSSVSPHHIQKSCSVQGATEK